MKIKLLISFVFLTIFFVSCVPQVMLNENKLSKDGLVFMAEKYSSSNYIAPEGFSLITIYFTIKNETDKIIKIDFDDLSLIDSAGKTNRVEFVEDKKPNDEGKIFLSIRVKGETTRKIQFMMSDRYSVNGLSYKDEMIKFK